MMLYSTSEPRYILFLNRQSRASCAFGLYCQWIGQHREGLNRLNTKGIFNVNSLLSVLDMEGVNKACLLAKKYRVVYYDGRSRYAMGTFR